jgi:hypothetical protein
MKRLRPHLTYANVMATVAVFVALGGSSYAALRIGSQEIADGGIRSVDVRDGTIRARDVGKNALGGSRIRESSLRGVPRAREADGLTSAAAEAVRVKCPVGTVVMTGLCFDSQASPPADYISAVVACGATNRGNRHLPTFAQLRAFMGAGGTIDPAGEFTANVSQGDGPGGLSVMVLEANTLHSFVSGDERRPFRCVINPSN